MVSSKQWVVGRYPGSGAVSAYRNADRTETEGECPPVHPPIAHAVKMDLNPVPPRVMGIGVDLVQPPVALAVQMDPDPEREGKAGAKL